MSNISENTSENTITLTGPAAEAFLASQHAMHNPVAVKIPFWQREGVVNAANKAATTGTLVAKKGYQLQVGHALIMLVVGSLLYGFISAASTGFKTEEERAAEQAAITAPAEDDGLGKN